MKNGCKISNYIIICLAYLAENIFIYTIGFIDDINAMEISPDISIVLLICLLK